MMFKHLHKQRARKNRLKNDKIYAARQALQPDLFPIVPPVNHEGPFDMSAKPHNHWRDFIPKAQIGNLSLT